MAELAAKIPGNHKPTGKPDRRSTGLWSVSTSRRVSMRKSFSPWARSYIELSSEGKPAAALCPFYKHDYQRAAAIFQLFETGYADAASTGIPFGPLLAPRAHLRTYRLACCCHRRIHPNYPGRDGRAGWRVIRYRPSTGSTRVMNLNSWRFAWYLVANKTTE
jgi:hypothetical protein